MTNSKNTKRALLASVLSVMLCIAMLIGSTFAWFTDSVTSGKNQIVAGNLDVELEYSVNGTDWTTVDENTNMFTENALWEPGYTEVVYLRVKNEGSLALKYKFGINVTDKVIGETADGQPIDLADFIEFGVVKADSAFADRTAAREAVKDTAVTVSTGYSSDEGHLTQGTTSDMLALVVYMPEEVGNEANHGTGKTQPEINMGISLVATQDTVEEDSFGKDYDAGATLDFVPVASADELTEAVKNGENISLTAPINLSEKLEVKKDITINGNGNTITVPDSADRVLNVTETIEPITITLNNVDLNGPTQGAYTRGLSIYNAPKVKIVMDNCSVSASYYAINLASAAPNVEIVVKNTTLTGWCAFQTHSPYANVTFENCTLIGLNDKGFNADGWNNFGTVVINGYSDGNPDPNGAHDGTFTFKNCRIEANQTTGNKQYLLDVRAKNTTVNVENCSFYVDGTQIGVDEIQNYVSVNWDVLDSFKFTIK